MSDSVVERHVALIRRVALINNAGWWVFIVGSLLVQTVMWFRDRSAAEFGWTAYTPLTDSMPRRYADYSAVAVASPWTDPAMYALGGFVVVVACSIVEAVLVRSILRGVVAVTAPFVGWLLLATVLPRSLWGGVIFDVPMVFVGVLVAIAVRQVSIGWLRRRVR